MAGVISAYLAAARVIGVGISELVDIKAAVFGEPLDGAVNLVVIVVVTGGWWWW
jgi:hypothetical protein